MKLGLAFGGFVGGLILSFYGYVANVAQTPLAITGIRLASSIYPAIALVLVVAALLIYKITKNLELQMQNELAERRKTYET